jgi:hypothetical protein
VTAFAIDVQPIILSILGAADAAVSPPLVKTATWAPVVGATDVEVDRAAIAIGPPETTEPVSPLALAQVGGQNWWLVTIPAPRTIHALRLDGLRSADNRALRDEADLAGLRVVVAAESPGRGFEPVRAVPAVGTAGIGSGSVGGARLQAGTLTLTDPLDAPRVRIALATGDRLDQLQTTTTAIDGVAGTLGRARGALTLTDTAGATIWASPALPAATPRTAIDLRQAARTAYNAQRGGGGPLTARFTVSGATGTWAAVTFTPPAGSIVRAWPGARRATVEAGPAVLPLEGSLSAERPTSSRADLDVVYLGLRLHPTLRDQPPAAGTVVEGTVVGEARVLRRLAPAALRGPRVARIAPIGRAPAGCTLLVDLVDEATGEPLGPPGTLDVAAGAAAEAHWVALPDVLVGEAPVAIGVRSAAGRFLWAEGSAGPLVRLALADASPGGRALTLGGTPVLYVTAQRTQARATTLPVTAFGAQAPALESELFLTVDVADLTLRYSR